MTYDPERHHRRSIRLRGYDDAGPGAYFVTICSYQQAMLFGRVVDGRMVPNEFGRIVDEEWVRSGVIRPYLELVAHVVMPNHMHGMVVDVGDEAGPATAGERGDGDAPDMRPEAAGTRASGIPPRRLRRPARSLGSFVAGFKAAAATRINRERDLPGTAVWQRNYHEHIVRDDDAMACIVNYVLTNPVRWMLDRENPDRWAEDEFEAWLGPGVVAGGSGR